MINGNKTTEFARSTRLNWNTGCFAISSTLARKSSADARPTNRCSNGFALSSSNTFVYGWSSRGTRIKRANNRDDSSSGESRRADTANAAAVDSTPKSGYRRATTRASPSARSTRAVIAITAIDARATAKACDCCR